MAVFEFDELFQLERTANAGYAAPLHLELSTEEAWLLDDVLCSPVWDRELFEWLASPDVRSIRDGIGCVILGRATTLRLDLSGADLLRRLVPAYWHSRGHDVATSVKRKLHGIVLA